MERLELPALGCAVAVIALQSSVREGSPVAWSDGRVRAVRHIPFPRPPSHRGALLLRWSRKNLVRRAGEAPYGRIEPTQWHGAGTSERASAAAWLRVWTSGPSIAPFPSHHGPPTPRSTCGGAALACTRQRAMTVVGRLKRTLAAHTVAPPTWPAFFPPLQALRPMPDRTLGRGELSTCTCPGDNVACALVPLSVAVRPRVVCWCRRLPPFCPPPQFALARNEFLFSPLFLRHLLLRMMQSQHALHCDARRGTHWRERPHSPSHDQRLSRCTGPTPCPHRDPADGAHWMLVCDCSRAMGVRSPHLRARLPGPRKCVAV